MTNSKSPGTGFEVRVLAVYSRARFLLHRKSSFKIEFSQVDVDEFFDFFLLFLFFRTSIAMAERRQPLVTLNIASPFPNPPPPHMTYRPTRSVQLVIVNKA